MAKKYWYFGSEALSPRERLDRVVKLLAKASCLLAVEELRNEKASESISASSPTLLPAKIGRVPYGKRKIGLDRAVDEREMKWVKRIQDMDKAGLSTEKIAKRLNEEDKGSNRSGKWNRTMVWRILQRLKEKGATN